MTTVTATTTGSESPRRAILSAALAVALFTVIILCPLLAAQATVQDCDMADTTDIAVMICMVIAVVLTEIVTLGTLRTLFTSGMLPTFLCVYLSSHQHNYIPPPKGRMAAFLTPLRI